MISEREHDILSHMSKDELICRLLEAERQRDLAARLVETERGALRQAISPHVTSHFIRCAACGHVLSPPTKVSVHSRGPVDRVVGSEHCAACRAGIRAALEEPDHA